MLVSILLSTQLVKDVEQTLGIPSVTRFTAPKIAVTNAKKRDIPAGGRTNQHDLKANARCFTLVSAIAEGWHIKFRHMRCV